MRIYFRYHIHDGKGTKRAFSCPPVPYNTSHIPLRRTGHFAELPLLTRNTVSTWPINHHYHTPYIMLDAMTALLSLPRVTSQRFSRSLMTVTRKRFSCAENSSSATNLGPKLCYLMRRPSQNLLISDVTTWGAWQMPYVPLNQSDMGNIKGITPVHPPWNQQWSRWPSIAYSRRPMSTSHLPVAAISEKL